MSSPPASTRPAATEPLLVACLCAAWCRTCDAYRDTLEVVREAIELSHPGAVRFTWVDVEDESALVGDLDIEDFPTVLVARGDTVLFFGPLMPHAQTLDRLVRAALDGTRAADPAALAPDVLALPRRLAGHEAI
ncbi:MAG TPA: thioredoxin domain-containing protein [Burkholderiaceae bacterium]